MKSLSITVLMLVMIALVTLNTSNAQSQPVPVECGSIVESEITPSLQSVGQFYAINLSPGDTLRMEAIPASNTLAIYIALIDPSNRRLDYRDYSPGQTAILEIQVASTGAYQIHIAGPSFAYIGAYSLLLSCVLRDGTVIPAGGDGTNPVTPTLVAPPTATPFSGIGFPGLAPVNMDNIARIPTVAGIPMSGGVTPTGSEILAYTFDGTTNEQVSVLISRLSGNLNLGVVVLSPDNRVVFQASLVYADTNEARLTLPVDGQYLIAVYRVDLAPPDVPEATAFQVQVAPAQ